MPQKNKTPPVSDLWFGSAPAKPRAFKQLMATLFFLFGPGLAIYTPGVPLWMAGVPLLSGMILYSNPVPLPTIRKDQ